MSERNLILDDEALRAWLGYLPGDVGKYEMTYWFHCPACALVKIGGTDRLVRRWRRLLGKHRRECLAWTGQPGPLQGIAVALGNWQTPLHRHFRDLQVKHSEWFAYTWVIQHFLVERGITDLPRPPRWTPDQARRIARDFRGAA
jgi:hypothetical protein